MELLSRSPSLITSLQDDEIDAVVIRAAGDPAQPWVYCFRNWDLAYGKYNDNWRLWVQDQLFIPGYESAIRLTIGPVVSAALCGFDVNGTVMYTDFP